MISDQELKLRHGEGYSIVADGISVDDRVHVLNYCDTFGIFDRLGDIVPGGKEVHGLYYKDTRFISKLQLLVNGSRPTLLNSTIEEENEVLSVDLTNSEIIRDSKRIP
jgi:glycogen debranching enzyme